MTRNTATGAGIFLLLSQNTGEVLIIAKNPAINNGTKIGSAARIPATTIIKAAAVTRNLLFELGVEDVVEGIETIVILEFMCEATTHVALVRLFL
jgi:hypothetical protein